MKNKKIITVFIVIAVILSLLIATALIMLASGTNMTTTRCVVTESGIVYMVYHGRLVKLNHSLDTDVSTGDKLFIIFNSAFAESFPEQTRAHAIIKLYDGDINDIELDDSYREDLERLGLVIK